jgi:nitroimidazol reductase NimA-like FMN-containing flavoprotein (pyridoxamine 5'-phosphate oxidase superfamily)
MDFKNLDMYGAEPIPWTRALRQLEAGDSKGSTWLATTRPDGRPHVAGIGAIWVDGTFYFVSGAGTRKSRNLAENPHCVLSVSLPDMDLVVEGTAAIVRDESKLARLAARYVAGGWPAEVGDGALTAPYSAPSAGPAPWDLYEVTVVTAFGVGSSEETPGATRWRFGKAG